MAPKFINLASAMDHTQLAESAVELNLKLMRWRVLPSLDLSKVFKTKVLILGAGTLGCNIARNLLAWGVRQITLVDNGKISFSNPVRQTLFVFDDSKEGRPKATTAAEMLKKIFPNIKARGVEMTIPMPGHPVEQKNEEEVKKSIQTLEQLIEEHDFTFLGLDSREARWLPTLIAASRNKAVINVALGFDTFVVMRHGSSKSSPQLGCYFCNDVNAPKDSITDRTLDQQCTVTRPGLSFISSGIAVELMVSLIQHPLGIAASHEGKTEMGNTTSTELGIIPHQIRGFLTIFQNIPMIGYQYSQCVACSHNILESYRKDPYGFCISVFNKPEILEDVSGITAMKTEQENTTVDWEIDEEFDV